MNYYVETPKTHVGEVKPLKASYEETLGVESIKQISDLLVKGFTDWKLYGNVKATIKGNLCIFNYTAKAQYAGTWNFFERVSRGLIINRVTGEIVARPFDKFFNYNEGVNPNSPIKEINQKMDGSLGILYWDYVKPRFVPKIATRGSFDSSQALWATNFLQTQYNKSSELLGLYRYNEYTLLFEIIYPENRVIVDYGGACDLTLLAARHRFTGEYTSTKKLTEIRAQYCFSKPRRYSFDSIDGILEAAEVLDSNSEGWVVEFENGERRKVKGHAYKLLHKTISGLSFKKVLAAVKSNKVNDLIALVPDEFLDEFKIWLTEIEDKRFSVSQEVKGVFGDSPKGSRKEFAIWVMHRYKKLAPYLFALFDGKPIDNIIYSKEFEDRKGFRYGNY